ncbi:MAG: 3-hydroxyacyl-ACP dehydratase FabZ [Gammaproteobacteria bacterium]|nr:3-hydroxyacyl-ACP dehydratase FabZ [Gammaproteobacteria bacterium]
MLNSLDINDILKHLPHRYPFLLIDRVLDYEPGKRLTAIKNISFNEPIFTGHFPQKPIYPGVLILESLAQATGILAFRTVGKIPDENSLYYFVGVDNARFKLPVEPGDQLQLDVEFVKEKRGIWKFNGKATVEGKLVCSAEIMCAERDV